MLWLSFCWIPEVVVLKTANALGKRVELALVVGPIKAFVKICGLVIVGLVPNTKLPVPVTPVDVTPSKENVQAPPGTKLFTLSVPVPGL